MDDFDRTVNVPMEPSAGKRTSGDVIVGDLGPGTTLGGGRYVILEVLGRGGMSIVYKARQEMIDRIVAIKALKYSLASDPSVALRFQREIKTLSRLNHPNIVTVFDCIFTDTGQIYFVMDYLGGTTLDLIVQVGGPLSPERFQNIFVQAASAVEHAHRHGVVHRDLKTSNVMIVDPGGRDLVKVVDFGLAKLGEEAQRLTQTGEVWGSPAFMSPEHCGNEELDARSDIYSLGVVMYKCLTGRLPFEGKSFFEIVDKHRREEPPSMESMAPQLEIPQSLQQIVMKCLMKAPAARFQSMGELKEALRGAISGSDQTQPNYPPDGDTKGNTKANPASLKSGAHPTLSSQPVKKQSKEFNAAKVSAAHPPAAKITADAGKRTTMIMLAASLVLLTGLVAAVAFSLLHKADLPQPVPQKSAVKSPEVPAQTALPAAVEKPVVHQPALPARSTLRAPAVSSQAPTASTQPPAASTHVPAVSTPRVNANATAAPDLAAPAADTTAGDNPSLTTAKPQQGEDSRYGRLKALKDNRRAARDRWRALAEQRKAAWPRHRFTRETVTEPQSDGGADAMHSIIPAHRQNEFETWQRYTQKEGRKGGE